MRNDKWSNLVFDNTNDLIFLIEIEPNEVFRCISVNPAYLRQTNLTEEQVVGKTPQEVLPKEAAEYVLGKYKQALVLKEKIMYEEHVQLPTGLIIVETTLTPVMDKNGKPTHLFGILRDVTERRTQEKALVESEQLLKDIFNLSPIPMLISTVKNGVIVMVNESFANAMGYSVSDLVGKTTGEMYHDPEFRKTIKEKILDNGRVKNFEISLKKTDNETAHFLFSSEIISMQGQEMFLSCFLDITERRHIQDALIKSESNLQTVFENTEIGYILLDSNLRILSYNQHASEFSYAEHGKFLTIGDYFYAFFPVERHEALKVVMEKVFKGTTVSHERSTSRNDGEYNWYNVKYSPVFVKDGTVAGVLLSLENITERKKNEIERNKSFELVSQQNKRLLDFSYIVSHNLRSHTSNIKAILDLLSMSESEAEQLELIDKLKVVSISLEDTLINLNDIVSIHSDVNITTESLDLSSYIDHASNILSDLISKKESTIFNKVEKGQKVMYNPAYLESILLNLISNAVRYSHPDRPSQVHIDYRMDGKIGILTIKDNGIGIDLARYGQKLFGMYKTFHGNKDAKGVGLFITKNQIETMGGKIEVESTPEIGTSFIVYIPQNL